ncbi:MAG: TRAP transporter substrate-binding protein [Candidatus Rokubacteria bacterium]|nr:TRAP transporter substrate-binding protein [Candidatus Rokubacteria bacterium]
MRKLIPLRSAIAIALALALLAFLAGSYSAPTPATAQAPIRWKVQSAWPPTSIIQDGAKLLVEMIEKNTGGRLKIELLPAGAIVPAFEIQDAVNRGVLDAGHTTAGYIIGKLQAFIPLTHGPLFGMDFIDYFGWYWEGGGQALFNEAYQKNLKMNVVSFHVAPGGPQAMGWFKKEIRTFEDIKGLKYRIYGIGAETYGKLGISAVTIPGGEIVPALERGVIDGAEWINCYDDKILGLDKVAKFHYAPGMHEPVTVGELIINKAKWDALPADLKEIIKTSIQASFWINFVRFQEKTAKACGELIAQGIKVIKTSDELNRRFLKTYDEIQAYASKDPFYKKVLDSQKKYAELIVPYRLSYWPPYNFIGEHYWKEKIWLK